MMSTKIKRVLYVAGSLAVLVLTMAAKWPKRW